MMTEEKDELTIDDLNKAIVGGWNLETLSEEEAIEYECLWGYFVSQIGLAKEEKARRALSDFEHRMDTKYGKGNL
jgi:hypothetical protein